MVIKKNDRDSRCKPRNAFTLLEVSIASMLSSVLMLLIYSSLDKTARMSSAGAFESSGRPVARTILHRISDDLRAFSDSGASYFPEVLSNAFTADRFDFAMVERRKDSKPMLVSDGFIMVKHSASPRSMSSIDSPTRQRVPKDCYVAYFVSLKDFGAELTEKLRDVGCSVQLPKGLRVNDQGFHRCFLQRKNQPTQFELIGIDEDYERDEVSALIISAFDGDRWMNAAEIEGLQPVAVRTMIQMEKPTGVGVNQSQSGSVRAITSRSQHSLITRMTEPHSKTEAKP